jgi:hypothetical protein
MIRNPRTNARFNGSLELLRHGEGGPCCTTAGVNDDVRKGGVDGLKMGAFEQNADSNDQNKLGLRIEE